MTLGYDTYSLRGWGWTIPQHVEFARNHQLQTIQVSAFIDAAVSDAAYQAAGRGAAREAGIVLEFGTGCICPTSKSYEGAPDYLVNSLKIAQGLGARTMACSLGNSDDRYDGKGIEFHIASTVRALRAVRSMAMDMGIRIAVENHSGDMQAWELKGLIEQAGKEFVGACLDTGNPFWCVEDPQLTMEILGPYTLTTHCRDTIVWEHARGCAAQWTSLGEGIVDLGKLAVLQKSLCPEAPLMLEVITGRAPRIVPYLEPSFWKGFANAKASEFARFVKLVKQGHPLMTPMVVDDTGGARGVPEYQAALKRQQMLDLDRSLAYARQYLL